jgi:hypothetical protein
MTDETEKKPESHEEASARRATELTALMATHRGHVKKAHEDHPTPPGVKFHEMNEADQKRFNEKRAVVDSANTAYCRQVKLACSRHQDEILADRLKFNMAWHEKMKAEEGAPQTHERPLEEPSDMRDSEGMAR